MKYLKLSFVLVVAVMLVGCGGGEQSAQQSDMNKVPFETSYTVEMRDGSKVFSPESRSVTGNTGSITIENTLDAPHGVRISGLGIEAVVNAGSSKTFNIASVEPGEYTVDCQLHSAHVESKLVVNAP
jgi:plastocyanin